MISGSNNSTKDSERMISSYDIFDTLLTRRVCDPHSVFLFMARDAKRFELANLTPEEFKNARVEAETLARIGVPGGEVNLAQIYKVFGRLAGFPEDKLPGLMQLELDWERRMLVPVPGAKETIQADRKAGNEVHFVSDIYLPWAFLEQFLRENGFMQSSDQLWLSNEHGATKRTGRLFSALLNHMKIAPGRIRHVGNDWEADVSAPKKMGIHTVHRAAANPTHHEILLEKYALETNGWTSLMAGAGRLVRLQSCANKRVAELRRIVGDVVCPALTCYVLWILQRAKISRLKRLYFISRDGYVPYLLAKHIAATLLPDLECRYFYGSRQAWHIAGLHDIDDAALEWILGHTDGMTCATLLGRLELSWEDCQRLAPEVATLMGKPKNPVTQNVRQAIATQLQAGRSLMREAVLAKAKARRDLLQEYARQEGLLDGVKVGMVDLGWFGRTRASLERALAGENVNAFQWFYLAIDQKAHLYDSDRVSYFLYGPELRHPAIPFLHEVVECFCLAPHGSVTGYRREEGKILPTFRESNEKNLDEWGREDFFVAIQKFLQNFSTELGQFPEIGNVAKAARKILTDFCVTPTVEDARLWGTIPFDQDQSAGIARVLAPQARLTKATIKNALLFGSVGRACMAESVGAWGAGSWSARRSPLYFLVLAAWIGYLRIHWKQLPQKFFSQWRRARVIL